MGPRAATRDSGARKAQLATHEYQEAGCGYVGGKDKDYSLDRWTEEDWGTKSGAESGEGGERYLPKRTREHLTDKEYEQTTAKKCFDTKNGRQFSSQLNDVARKSVHDRPDADDRRSKSALCAEAQRHEIVGRSIMSKAELKEALR